MRCWPSRTWSWSGLTSMVFRVSLIAPWATARMMLGMAQSEVSVRNLSMLSRWRLVMGRLMSVKRDSCSGSSLRSRIWAISLAVIFRIQPVRSVWVNFWAGFLSVSLMVFLLPRRCSGLQSIVAQGRGVGFWSFRRLGCHPAMVRADCLREEVTANECLGTKAQVPEKMNAFFDGLAHRKDEVRHRCRTLLQARADALMFTPAVPLPPLQNVVPTLALV